MAFISMRRPHLELLTIKRQLTEGLISATDAAVKVGEIVFDPDTMQATPASDAWRKYDTEITAKTIALIDELTK